MGKIKKFIPKIILLDTILYGALFVAICFLLSLFKLRFRQWMYIVSLGLLALGFIVGVIQLLLTIKLKALKIGLISTFVLLMVLAAPFVMFLAAFCSPAERVVQRDGVTYLAYVHSFLHTSVDFYDYHNLLVVGSQKRFREWGDGTFDLDECKWTFSTPNVIYYDENGEVLYEE